MLTKYLATTGRSAAMVLLLAGLTACGSGSDETSENKGQTGNQGQTTPDCTNESKSWTDEAGLLNCISNIGEGSEGDIVTITDTGITSIGAAEYQCAGNQWLENKASCVTGGFLSLAVTDTAKYSNEILGAYYELGKTYGDSQEIDGPFKISDGSEIPGAFDAFPFEGDWTNALQVELDLSELDQTTFAGTAPVISLAADFNQFMSTADAYVNAGYSTTFANVTGNLEFAAGGALSGGSISADVTFTLVVPEEVLGQEVTLNFPGTLLIENRNFTLDVSGSADIGEGPKVVSFNATGTFSVAQ